MKNFIKFFLVAVFALSFVTVNAESNTTSVSNGDIDPEGGSVCLDLSMSLRYKDNDSKTGGQISQLQDFLVSQGYMTGNPTGYFGLVTFGAVKKFQSQYGFSPTGFVGPLTRGKIKDITCTNNGGTISLPPPPINPSDRSNSNSNLPRGCTSNTSFSPLTGERCVFKDQNSTTQQPYISRVSVGKYFDDFAIAAGESAYITGSNLSNVSVSVGGKMATVAQAGDSYIHATMPGSLVPGQTYDLYVFNEKGEVSRMSNVVKVRVISKVSVDSTLVPYITGTNGKAVGDGEVYPGETVNVLGTNLLGNADTTYGTSVYIGDTLCPITQINPNRELLSCVVSKNLQFGGTYDLYIKSSSGVKSNVIKVRVPSKMTSTQPSIKITSPNFGESFVAGQQVTVRYAIANFPRQVNVQLQLNKGDTPIQNTSYIASTGSYVFTIPTNAIPGNDYRVMINADYPNTETSQVFYSNNFTVTSSTSSTQPSITVFNPNGGESFKKGDYIPMSWSSVGMDNVSVSLISSSGASYLVSSFAPANAGGAMKDYSWLIPDSLPLGSYKVKVSGYFTGKGSIDDISDSYFTIVSPTSSTQLSITGTDSTGQIIPGSRVVVYGSNIQDGSYVWFDDNQAIYPISRTSNSIVFLVPANATIGSHTIKVRTQSRDQSPDISSNSLKINVVAPSTSSTQPSITVLSPNGGEQWYSGNIYSVTWKSTGVSRVSLWACNNVGTCARVLNTPAMGVANNGSYSLTNSQLPFSGSMKIRVASEDNYPTASVYDDSNDYFTAIGSTSSFNSNQDMTANMFEALRSVNPSLYR